MKKALVTLTSPIGDVTIERDPQGPYIVRFFSLTVVCQSREEAYTRAYNQQAFNKALGGAVL